MAALYLCLGYREDEIISITRGRGSESKECHRYCAWYFHRCYERATQSAQHGTLAGTAHGVTKILQTEAPLCTEASPLSVSGRRSSAATIASASVAALHPLPGRRFELVRAARDPLLKRSIRKPPGLSSPPPTPPGATDPRQHDSVYLFSPPSYPSTSTSNEGQLFGTNYCGTNYFSIDDSPS